MAVVYVVDLVEVQRKPDNRKLPSSCKLICKIIQIEIGRELLLSYYRVFSGVELVDVVVEVVKVEVVNVEVAGWMWWM